MIVNITNKIEQFYKTEKIGKTAFFNENKSNKSPINPRADWLLRVHRDVFTCKINIYTL